MVIGRLCSLSLNRGSPIWPICEMPKMLYSRVGQLGMLYSRTSLHFGNRPTRENAFGVLDNFAFICESDNSNLTCSLSDFMSERYLYQSIILFTFSFTTLTGYFYNNERTSLVRYFNLFKKFFWVYFAHLYFPLKAPPMITEGGNISSNGYVINKLKLYNFFVMFKERLQIYCQISCRAGPIGYTK